MLGEATVNGSVTFLREAIRLLTLIVAPHRRRHASVPGNAGRGLNQVGDGADPIDQPSDLRRPDQGADCPGKLSRITRALNRILMSRMTRTRGAHGYRFRSCQNSEPTAAQASSISACNSSLGRPALRS
jgi:hypothetical protein